MSWVLYSSHSFLNFSPIKSASPAHNRPHTCLYYSVVSITMSNFDCLEEIASPVIRQIFSPKLLSCASRLWSYLFLSHKSIWSIYCDLVIYLNACTSNGMLNWTLIPVHVGLLFSLRFIFIYPSSFSFHSHSLILFCHHAPSNLCLPLTFHSLTVNLQSISVSLWCAHVHGCGTLDVSLISK